jgi:hypothetical protein
VHFALLLIFLNDWEAGICKDVETLLDGLNVIVDASRAFSSLQQSLQQDLFWAFKVEDKLTRNHLSFGMQW